MPIISACHLVSQKDGLDYSTGEEVSPLQNAIPSVSLSSKFGHMLQIWKIQIYFENNIWLFLKKGNGLKEKYFGKDNPPEIFLTGVILP